MVAVQVQTVTDGMNNFSTVNSLLSAAAGDINVNVKVRAADINAIKDIYNNWNAHTHSVNDIAFIAFGNIPGQPSASAIDTTSAPRSTSDAAFPAITATAGVDNKVGLTVVNAQVNKINAIRTHRHTIDDTAT